jgi:nucleoprotein TPR
LTQALSKVQALQGQIAEQESKYASEANGLKRLVEMMEEREKQAKEIVQNIETEWATVGEKAERRENALKLEIEHERQGREEAERRIDTLETVVHRMGRGDLPLHPGGTPLRTPGGVDRTEDGMMGLSPTVALASRSQKSGKTFTQVYEDFVKLQEDFDRKCLEHQQMERTLSQVLAEIEERAPILSRQREEYDRISEEATHLSQELAAALEQRDEQLRIAQDQSQKVKALNKENGLLQKQLGDLGRQVQTLLREITRRDDPTIPMDDEPEQPAPAASVDEVITNNLVLFRNIEGLQEQNQKLLKVTREMGEKMENEEREYKEAMDEEQAKAIQEASQMIRDLEEKLEEEKRRDASLIQGYKKERDTLRLLLDRANGGRGLAAAMAIEPANESEVASQLAEVQNQFEAYKTEIGLDSTMLREKLIAAERESHEFGAALAKANAKVEFLNDRLRIHQDDYQVRDRQLDELSKRNQQLFDQYTRVDIECNRVTEELHISNGRLEQLRNECANLRAEKNIWATVQSRLVDENRALSVERSHLAGLMTNIQRMHGDLERSGENDRRRLEGQLQMLEGQTQDLRTQLSRERDTVRHLTLQKELEAKELQTRLDKAVSFTFYLLFCRLAHLDL